MKKQKSQQRSAWLRHRRLAIVVLSVVSLLAALSTILLNVLIPSGNASVSVVASGQPVIGLRTHHIFCVEHTLHVEQPLSFEGISLNITVDGELFYDSGIGSYAYSETEPDLWRLSKCFRGYEIGPGLHELNATFSLLGKEPHTLTKILYIHQPWYASIDF